VYKHHTQTCHVWICFPPYTVEQVQNLHCLVWFYVAFPAQRITLGCDVPVYYDSQLIHNLNLHAGLS